MSGIQTNNGKAFEYACLNAIFAKVLSESEVKLGISAKPETAREFWNATEDVVQVERTPQLETAESYFCAASGDMRRNLICAANAAARVVIRLEPQILFPDKNKPLYLSLQTDAQGQLGDVRDVLCIRKQNEWEIGLSCKHNHHAVKHSRLSATIDFGREWFDIPCSYGYFNAITPLFEQLRSVREMSNGTALWSNIEDKNELYYIPVLIAFMDELRRLDSENPRVIPERLIRYLIGRNDFYKIITDDTHKTTRVEAINIYGTLNRPSEGKQSIVNVPRLRLPSQFYHIGFRKGSQTTIEVVCDEGWTVSMRIHNASSRVEPSLKFDVNLISLPSTIHAQVEPW